MTPLPVDRTCTCLEWRIRNPAANNPMCVGYHGCNLRPAQPKQYHIMKAVVEGTRTVTKPFPYAATIEWRRAWYVIIREWYYNGITKT